MKKILSMFAVSLLLLTLSGCNLGVETEVLAPESAQPEVNSDQADKESFNELEGEVDIDAIIESGNKEDCKKIGEPALIQACEDEIDGQ